MAHGHKSYDRPSPDGVAAAKKAAAVDKIPTEDCRCGATVHLDSDGRGNVTAWDWVGGAHPGYRLHRCRP
jgi:hypothetical protein